MTKSYTPRFQSQLGRGPTDSSDCGVRSTQMAIDWATEGTRRPSAKELRTRMGVPTGGTSPNAWCDAIESYDTPVELGGKFEFLACADVTNSPTGWARLAGHVNAGRGAVLAVDYGKYRALAPHKAGSETFNGNHAVFVLGTRLRSTGTQWLIWDPLNDGRRAGIPDGPVWVPLAKVKAAAEAVEDAGKTWAVLVWRGKEIVNPAPIPAPLPPTLYSVLADLKELRDVLSGDPEQDRVDELIEDLQIILGPVGPDSFASPDDEPGPEAFSAVEVAK